MRLGDACESLPRPCVHILFSMFVFQLGGQFVRSSKREFGVGESPRTECLFAIEQLGTGIGRIIPRNTLQFQASLLGLAGGVEHAGQQQPRRW